MEADFRGRGTWNKGNVAKVEEQDGIFLYHVLYDDGYLEKSVAEQHIRQVTFTHHSTVPHI